MIDIPQSPASANKKNRLPIFQTLSSSGESENTSNSSNDTKRSESPLIHMDQGMPNEISNIIQISNFPLNHLDNLKVILNNITNDYYLNLEELANKVIFLKFTNSIHSEKAMKTLKDLTKYELRYFADLKAKKNDIPFSFQDNNYIYPYNYNSYGSNLDYGLPMKYSPEFVKSNSNSSMGDYYFNSPRTSNSDFNTYPYNLNMNLNLNTRQNPYEYPNGKPSFERLNLNLNTNYHINYTENYINGKFNGFYPLYLNSNMNGNLNSNSQFSPINNESSKSSHNPNRKKHKMDQKEELEKNKINLERIAQKLDKRTTIMIKNIPYKMHKDDVLKLIEKNFSKKYDFFYIPIDIKNKSNLGYGFINLKNYEDIIEFYYELNGYKWIKHNSEKICALSYARIQGLNELLKHFEKTFVMNQDNDLLRPEINLNDNF